MYLQHRPSKPTRALEAFNKVVVPLRYSKACCISQNSVYEMNQSLFRVRCRTMPCHAKEQNETEVRTPPRCNSWSWKKVVKRCTVDAAVPLCAYVQCLLCWVAKCMCT